MNNKRKNEKKKRCWLALSSNPSTAKRKKKEGKEGGRERGV
jgi:hypothetical protein